MNFRSLSLLVAGLVCVVPAFAAPVDLGHPTLAVIVANNIGNGDRSAVFDALSGFSIDSAGFKFDPLSGGATQVTVSIYESALNGTFSNGSAPHGALLATASAPITDVGLAFYDIPIAFTFLAGDRYDLAFSALGEWGFGLNDGEFYAYNFASPGGPYVAGPVSVVDGASHNVNAGYDNTVMPHLRLNVVDNPVPEPATLALVALGVAGLGFSRRKQ